MICAISHIRNVGAGSASYSHSQAGALQQNGESGRAALMFCMRASCNRGRRGGGGSSVVVAHAARTTFTPFPTSRRSAEMLSSNLIAPTELISNASRLPKSRPNLPCRCGFGKFHVVGTPEGRGDFLGSLLGPFLCQLSVPHVHILMM